MDMVNMSNASSSSVEQQLPTPFQLVPVTGVYQQIDVLYGLYAVLILLSLASLVRRWKHGHRVLLTCRDGVIVPGTTTLLLLVFTAFLCVSELFLWMMSRVFRQETHSDDLVPVWSTAWGLLVLVAFVEVWGLWGAVNFRPGKLRRHGQRKLLIPALPFNIAFGSLFALFVTLITVAGFYCTRACMGIWDMQAAPVIDVPRLNRAIRDCEFWIRFRNITFSCSLGGLVVLELVAYLLLRRRLSAEIVLLQREYDGWNGGLELDCSGGWAKSPKSSRPASYGSSASATEESLPTTSSLPDSASLAIPSPLRSPPSPHIGPLIITRSGGEEKFCFRPVPTTGMSSTSSCPRRRAEARRWVRATLTVHAVCLTLGMLAFGGVAVAETLFMGGLALKGWGTIVTLGILWSVPITGFPILSTVLLRSSSTQGSFLGTTTVPILSRHPLDEKAALDDEEEDIHNYAFQHGGVRNGASGSTVHVELPPGHRSQSSSSHSSPSVNSSNAHRLPHFTLGRYHRS